MLCLGRTHISCTFSNSVSFTIKSGNNKEYTMDHMQYNQYFPINIPDISALPRPKQRQMIGQYLYPVIHSMYPQYMPHKLTDILVDLNSINSLLCMTKDPVFFHAKLTEAVSVLQTYYNITT